MPIPITEIYGIIALKLCPCQLEMKYNSSPWFFQIAPHYESFNKTDSTYLMAAYQESASQQRVSHIFQLKPSSSSTLSEC